MLYFTAISGLSTYIKLTKHGCAILPLRLSSVVTLQDTEGISLPHNHDDTWDKSILPWSIADLSISLNSRKKWTTHVKTSLVKHMLARRYGHTSEALILPFTCQY